MTASVRPIPRLRSRPAASRAAMRFAVACAAVGVVWLVVLPWIAARPAVDDHLRHLKERGVDPSAMYYTELECLEPVLDRLNRAGR